MAFYIRIRKLNETRTTVDYSIDTQDFEFTKPLVISINKHDKKLYFLENNVCAFLLDLNNPILEKDTAIDTGLLLRINKVVSEAIKSNNFPDILDYCA